MAMRERMHQARYNKRSSWLRAKRSRFFESRGFETPLRSKFFRFPIVLEASPGEVFLFHIL
jgi:hypothetical protein